MKRKEPLHIEAMTLVKLRKEPKMFYFVHYLNLGDTSFDYTLWPFTDEETYVAPKPKMKHLFSFDWGLIKVKVGSGTSVKGLRNLHYELEKNVTLVTEKDLVEYRGTLLGIQTGILE